jgi:hypothetical protein
MKKKLQIIALCFLLLIVNKTIAQHEYYGTSPYGVNSIGPNYYGGRIFKVDSLGANYQVVHEFDSIPADGANPYGALMQASNGKIYGTTQYGGESNNGVLFEYDPILDSLQVLVSTPITFRYALMQASNGKIYYTSSTASGYLTEYDITTNTLTQSNIFLGSGPIGNLTELNGKLYGTQHYGGGQYHGGEIYSYNLANSAFIEEHIFACLVEGCLPNSQPVYDPINHLFYGVAEQQLGGFGNGMLYSYNPSNNVVTHLLNIPDSIGNGGSLTVGTNHKLYGIGAYGTDINGTHNGCIFEFNPANNNIRITHNFGLQPGGAVNTGGQSTAKLLLASNGKMYGFNNLGPFQYDYLNGDTVTLTNILGGYSSSGFLEICRKPSYKYFKSDTVAVCLNNSFSYTIHSDNARTYSWKKNGVLMPLQSDSTLYFPNFSVNDTAFYTCYMTNQCGYTETATEIKLVVSPLPTLPVITLNEGQLNSTSAFSYQWYLNGTIIAGANSQTYTPTQIGNYTVEIADNTGCSSTSTPYNFLATGINTTENEINEVKIFPNPFDIETTISFSKEQKNSTIKITDILGKEIKTLNFTGSQLLIEKGEMIKGVYFIQISNENKISINKKIVVE